MAKVELLESLDKMIANRERFMSLDLTRGGMDTSAVASHVSLLNRDVRDLAVAVRDLIQGREPPASSRRPDRR